MADVKWIKIVTDIFEDEKILLIETLPESDSIIVVWFKLLCLAGKQNNSGVFMLNDKIPYTDNMLSKIFRRSESVVKLALKTFVEFGMIEIIDNVITIPNWEKHQKLDKLEKIQENARKRVAKHREKQKIMALEGNVTCNVTVTESNADRIDIDKLHYIKLIDLYKYIYRGQQFEKLTEADRQAIVMLLKKLDVYIEQEKVFGLLTDEQKLDILIQTWVAKELCRSSYKVYLHKLTRDKFINIYLRCKERIVNKNSKFDVEKFVNYLIKSLRNELEKEK